MLVKSQCLMVQTLIKQQQQKIKVNTAAYVKYFELLTKNNWQIFSADEVLMVDGLKT